MMKASEIRTAFLEFFREREHTIVPSAPIVPGDDPTLLFTNAGMNQFKDVFVGTGTRPYKRAVDSQKCIRVSGKHNDLEEVGRDGRHHTFFEMLGNWSFGDYYKSEAIRFGWEFITGTMQLDPDRVWVTIYKDDEEAYQIWTKEIKIPAKRVVRLGDIEQENEENFWSMGGTGPCGPCTEIHYDQGDTLTCGDNCGIGKCDCDRYLELWNLVFMQYNQTSPGEFEDLPMKSVDTGMSLERLAAVKQNVFSTYDTDLFVPIIQATEGLCGKKYTETDHTDSFRVIADHIRTLSIAIADGVIPSNESRGYVIRRVLRRAVRHGKLLDLHEPFLCRLVDPLVTILGDTFQELKEKRNTIEKIIQAEEAKFIETLDSGINHFESVVADMAKKKLKKMPGTEVFKLYDTYGFPVDLTTLMARERGLQVDTDGFEAAMDKQKARGRDTSKFQADARDELGEWVTVAKGAGDIFIGYDELQTETKILRCRSKAASVEVVLEKTPFYAESGGQIGDTGRIYNDQLEIKVTDVIKDGNTIVHCGEAGKGELDKAGEVTAAVDPDRRLATQRNHTATHVLHRALKKVLGEHVNQSGSLVTPDRLRFDFNHFSAVTGEEQEKIERIASETVLKNREVKTNQTSLAQAKAEGATALFGEKYGDEVRVVSIEGYSKELCGGTHVQRTGDIGRIRIVSEGSVASGIRRIEAVTGQEAFNHEMENEKRLQTVARQLGCGLNEVEEYVKRLIQKNKELAKTLKKGGGKATTFEIDFLIDQAQEIDGIKVVSAAVPCKNVGELRSASDRLRDKIGSGIGFLFADIDGKASVSGMVTKDLSKKYPAGDLLKKLLAGIGRGGGQAHFAQGGFPDVSQIDSVIKKVPGIIKQAKAI
jgi:alanyl-tRNA synthetase